MCDWLFKGAQGIPAHYKKHITQGRSQEEKEAGQAAWDEHKAYMRAKDAVETRAGTRNGARAGPKPRERLVPASFLPANAALDPNGDLASHGGALAGWPEHEWVPHPSESVLRRLAESSLAARRKPLDGNVAPPPPSRKTTTVRRNARKIVFDDEDNLTTTSATPSSSDTASDPSSSSDTASDSDSDSDPGGSEEKRENAPPPARKKIRIRRGPTSGFRA